jgi:hypothetical protein
MREVYFYSFQVSNLTYMKIVALVEKMNQIWLAKPFGGQTWRAS